EVHIDEALAAALEVRVQLELVQLTADQAQLEVVSRLELLVDDLAQLELEVLGVEQHEAFVSGELGCLQLIGEEREVGGDGAIAVLTSFDCVNPTRRFGNRSLDHARIEE